MTKAKECEHGLPYGICMDDKCVQKFMGGRLQRFDDDLMAQREDHGPDADMDTILAHECQHGSDMRVCQKCALVDQVVRTMTPSGSTVEEWLEDIEATLDI